MGAQAWGQTVGGCLQMFESLTVITNEARASKTPAMPGPGLPAFPRGP